RLDAGKLLSMLIRWHHGEKNVWSVVQVPGVLDEDRRQLHRDLLELRVGKGVRNLFPRPMWRAAGISLRRNNQPGKLLESRRLPEFARMEVPPPAAPHRSSAVVIGGSTVCGGSPVVTAASARPRPPPAAPPAGRSRWPSGRRVVPAHRFRTEQPV